MILACNIVPGRNLLCPYGRNLEGYGLGWQLMRHLIHCAKAGNHRELHGAGRADNATMLQMCRRLGFAIDLELGDVPLQRGPLRTV
jgi:hypothetical protein